MACVKKGANKMNQMKKKQNTTTAQISAEEPRYDDVLYTIYTSVWFWYVFGIESGNKLKIIEM